MVLGHFFFYIYQKATKVIELRNKERNAGDRNEIICRFGQKMIPSVPILWRFYSPSVEWIYETYLENGIDAFWTREFYGRNIASRIQDRNKIKNFIKIEPDSNSVKPMAITLRENHFMTVVTLGTACIIVCILFLVLELCIYKSSAKSVKTKGNSVKIQMTYMK